MLPSSGHLSNRVQQADQASVSDTPNAKGSGDSPGAARHSDVHLGLCPGCTVFAATGKSDGGGDRSEDKSGVLIDILF